MAAVAFSDLRDAIEGELLFDEITRALYATDASIYRILPAAVALPKTTADVQQIVRFALDGGLSVVPRGGGSGLAGEAVGPGIVIDFSRFMHRKIEIHPHDRTVTVQAGVVLSRMNKALAEHGLTFGPDPASADRCTIGGMIANNSTGAHSIKYGCTREQIVRLKLVLANGTCVEVGEGLPVPESMRALDEALRKRLIRDAALIETHTPKVGRNRSGYLLDGILDGDRVDYPRLLAASEGTLAIVTEATLRVVALPKAKGIVVLGFGSLDAAARAVVDVLEDQPSTVEMIDDKVIDIGTELTERFGQLIPAEARFVLVVERDGETAAEVQKKLAQTSRRVAGTGSVIVEDASDQDLIWATRNAAEPLLYRKRWPLQPTCFVEDVAVAPEKLAIYLERQGDILAKYSVDSAYYAHAGHGELHVKPYLNLHTPEDRNKMKAIAEEVHTLATELGGTISGEHGEGLLRAQFIPQQYGALYDSFVQIKNLFDPHGTLNPGKKINDTPDLLLQNLRAESEPRFPLHQYRYEAEGIDEIVDRCNGCAACRTQESKFDMCPIFKVVGDETAAPRAKANLMRELLSGNLDPTTVRTHRFKEVAHLCVNCKMCHLECPSGVDIPKLMLDAKAMHVEQMGLTVAERLLIHTEGFARTARWIAPLVNWGARVPLFRAAAQKVTGIDRRRRLPAFSSKPFLARKRKTSSSTSERKVAYFVDLYANYNDPALAEDLVSVLEHNGVQVVVPEAQVGCGMPAIDNGDLKSARHAIDANLNALARYVEEGYTVVSAEPTATLTLKEEYGSIADDPRAGALANAAVDVCDYLWEMHKSGTLKEDFREIRMTLGYHAPCHLKALQIGRPGMELVRLIPGVQVETIDEGCCGIAGTYGFKQSGYDNSMKIGAGLFGALAKSDIRSGLTECSTCKMQMEQGAGKRTLHPITVLAAGYGLRTLEIDGWAVG